jgi:hypothetical protein
MVLEPALWTVKRERNQDLSWSDTPVLLHSESSRHGLPWITFPKILGLERMVRMEMAN